MEATNFANATRPELVVVPIGHNAPMNFRQPSPRWALWVFAAALLLKSAMPWLASASAQMQGKTLVEVCTVYGVSLVAPGGGTGEPAPEHASDHGSEHCALTALTALAPIEPAVFAAVPVLLRAASPPRAHPSSAGARRLRDLGRAAQARAARVRLNPAVAGFFTFARSRVR